MSVQINKHSCLFKLAMLKFNVDFFSLIGAKDAGLLQDRPRKASILGGKQLITLT